MIVYIVIVYIMIVYIMIVYIMIVYIIRVYIEIPIIVSGAVELKPFLNGL